MISRGNGDTCVFASESKLRNSLFIVAYRKILRNYLSFKNLSENRRTKKKAQTKVWAFLEFGAGNEARTRDLNLGKVALYQLSYSRMFVFFNTLCKFGALQRSFVI